MDNNKMLKEIYNIKDSFDINCKYDMWDKRKAVNLS